MAHFTMGHGVSRCFGTRLAPIALIRGLRITPSTTSGNLTHKKPQTRMLLK